MWTAVEADKEQAKTPDHKLQDKLDKRILAITCLEENASMTQDEVKGAESIMSWSKLVRSNYPIKRFSKVR
jgi:hypothetical protein